MCLVWVRYLITLTLGPINSPPNGSDCCVPGFITDGNSKLVGNARLRQLRVLKNSCQIAGSMLHLVPDCPAPYSWAAEDMGSYSPGWNQSVMSNISMSGSSPWRYQTQAQVKASDYWGNLAFYRGGGFVAELGPDLLNASRWEHLKTKIRECTSQ